MNMPAFGGPEAAEEPLRGDLCGRGKFVIDFEWIYVPSWESFGRHFDQNLATLDGKMGVGLASSFPRGFAPRKYSLLGKAACAESLNMDTYFLRGALGDPRLREHTHWMV